MSLEKLLEECEKDSIWPMHMLEKTEKLLRIVKEMKKTLEFYGEHEATKSGRCLKKCDIIADE